MRVRGGDGTMALEEARKYLKERGYGDRDGFATF